MMTELEYIEKFNMDKPGRGFVHQDFLAEFNKEFNERLEKVNTYAQFKELVKFMADKFIRIRQLRATRGKISDKLWKAFFAIYVVPKREELFPERQEYIDQLKARGNGQNSKKSAR